MAAVIDYKTTVLADAPVGYWRLADAEGYAQAVLADAPVGYWRMADANDASGNARTLTSHSGVTFGQASAIADPNASALFDGTTNAYLSRASEAALQIVGDLSIEFWLYTTSLATAIRCVSKGHTGEYELYVSTLGTITIAHGDGSSFVTFSSTAGVIAINTQYHIVVTRNAAKKYQFWVNAVDQGLSGAYTTPVPTAGANAFQIGKSPTLAGPVTGYMDEVAIYNYALSAQQVANHYALRTSNITTVAAATIADSSGNARNGTKFKGVTLRQAGAITWDATDRAAKFDAITGYSSVPNAVALQITGDLTLECWVYINSLATRQTVLSKDSSREFELTLETSGALNFFNGNATDGTVNHGSGTGKMTAGAWKHLVATRVASTRIITFYVNGVNVDSGAYGGTHPTDTSTNLVYIGVNVSGGAPSTQLVNGLIDEVAIYNVALSAGQVAAHYAAKSVTIGGVHAGAASVVKRGAKQTTAGGIHAGAASITKRGAKQTSVGGVHAGAASTVKRGAKQTSTGGTRAGAASTMKRGAKQTGVGGVRTGSASLVKRGIKRTAVGGAHAGSTSITHTGGKLLTKVRLEGQVNKDAVLTDGSVPFTAAQSLGGHQLNSVADPTLAQDAATKAYVDAHSGGGSFSILTNGDATSPALIFTDAGDVITTLVL